MEVTVLDFSRYFLNKRSNHDPCSVLFCHFIMQIILYNPPVEVALEIWLRLQISVWFLSIWKTWLERSLWRDWTPQVGYLTSYLLPRSIANPTHSSKLISTENIVVINVSQFQTLFCHTSQRALFRYWNDRNVKFSWKPQRISLYFFILKNSFYKIFRFKTPK